MAGKHTILALSSITRVMYREENECGAGMAAMSLGQMLLMAELMLSRRESDWKERREKSTLGASCGPVAYSRFHDWHRSDDSRLAERCASGACAVCVYNSRTSTVGCALLTLNTADRGLPLSSSYPSVSAE